MVDRTVDFLAYASDDVLKAELNVSGSFTSSTFYNPKLPKTPFLIKAVDLVSYITTIITFCLLYVT